MPETRSRNAWHTSGRVPNIPTIDQEPPDLRNPRKSTFKNVSSFASFLGKTLPLKVYRRNSLKVSNCLIGSPVRRLSTRLTRLTRTPFSVYT